MDYQLFAFINSLAGTSKIGDFVFVFLSEYLIIIMILMLAYFTMKGKKTLALYFTLWAGLAYGFNYLISLVYFRSRPFVDHAVVQLIEKSAKEKSFPSDHSTLAFYLATCVYFFFGKKTAYVMYVMAVLVGLGRILVGVHYPGDIAAGALVGILFGSLAEHFYHHDRVSPEQPARDGR